MTTDTDYAWAAGFMDGDGHIGLRMVASTGTTNPRFSATQAIREPLEELHRLFGGLIKGPFQSKRGHSDQYIWALTNTKDIVAAVNAILPYLKVKRRQAVLLVSYLEMVSKESSQKYQGLTEDAIRARIVFYTEMQELNRVNQHRAEVESD